jgi:electron transfer flavoprotein beta subunit
MGCHDGIHLLTANGADPGQAAAAGWIAEFAGNREYELILCGSMSEDFMCGQVPAMLAAHLDLPFATQVIGMQLCQGHKDLQIEREIEGGAREVLAMRLPALLALQPGINQPRYPSLSNMLRANRVAFKTIPTGTLKPLRAQVECVGFRLPSYARASQVITGSALEKAARLTALLKAKSLI